MPTRVTRKEFLEIVRSAAERDPSLQQEVTGRTIADFLRTAGFARDDDDVETSLRRFQRYHGVAESGRVDAATEAVLSKSRCLLPDLSAVAASVACGWSTPVLRYAFADGTADLAGRAEFDVMRRALRTLSRSGAPHFVERTEDDPDLSVLVEWTPADCPDSDMTGTNLAHADYPPKCFFYDAALPQPVHFDDEEHTWSDGGSPTDFDVESVGLHEAGHIVGLQHSSVQASVMYTTFGAGEQRRQLHADDLAGIMSLYRGRAHTHVIKPDATVGARKETKVWTAGWTSATTFTTRDGTFLFLLKHGTGDVHVHRLTANGKIGARVVDTGWSPWWTTATFFAVGGDTYLFLLKERGFGGDGNNVHVHRMRSDGTVGDRVASYTWTEGWTTATFYSVGNETFLFLLKERGFGDDGNNVHVHRVGSDGTIGERTASYKWTEGWTTASFFAVGDETFLFLLKERGLGDDDNNVHIHRVERDGTIVARRWFGSRWTEGWTSAEFFEMGGATYLILVKLAGVGDDGNNVHVHRMASDGKVGERCASYRWSEGWSSVRVYDASDGPNLLLVKSCDPLPT